MRPTYACPLCGQTDDEHRDADESVVRCPNVEIERTSAQPVYLRELYL